MKRMLSLALALLMILSVCHLTVFAQGEGAPAQSYITDKVADPSTFNGWKNYFTDNNTENAGGVWTDKSVFASLSDYSTANEGMPQIYGDNGSLTMKDGTDDFLVALSAISSNKSIVGYDTVPTDTMLILDLSSSMYGGLNFDSSTVEQMVTAVNSAIGKLLALNKHNRVGVSIYYGGENRLNSTSGVGSYKTLLNLNRYVASTNDQYITVVKSGNKLDRIQTDASLKFESNNGVPQVIHDVNPNHQIAGTYTQLGIKAAADQFLKADPAISSAEIQGGKTRLPIFVLMSDGEPTAADNDYWDLGVSAMGNNTVSIRNPAETDFVTQLTAALAKEKVDAHYAETTPLFYTLTLGLSCSPDVMGNGTSENTNTINTYWNNLINNSSVQINVTNCSGAYSAADTPAVLTVSKTTVTEGGAVFPSSIEQQKYVDKAFEAANANQLTDAFDDIVAEITLQSLYTPTLVDSSGRENSGYIEFIDDIGLFMEVKDIKGIQLGNHLYTGAELAEKIIDSSQNGMGTRDNPTDLGNNLIWSIIDRLGIDHVAGLDTYEKQVEVARNLVRDCYTGRQLHYTDSNDFSNYITWYADADGNYLGYWDDTDPSAKYSGTGAVYKVRSYGMLGDATEANLDAASDMMYISIQVRTNITDGTQSVIWKIPAALIPVITYKVTLPNANLSSDPQSVQYEGSQPIRLLYEVGLRDDITPYNVTQKVDTDYTYKDSVNGGYYFYTNQWDAGKLGSEHPSAQINTVSWFEPSKENERYYYTEDTPVYVNNGTEQDPEYAPYTGDSAPSAEGEYYRPIYVYKKDGNQWKSQVTYEQMSETAIGLAAKNKKGNVYYVPSGTIHRYLDDYKIKKDSNATGTLIYSSYPSVEANTEQQSTIYYADAVLGNNGRVTMTPATGLLIGKTVASTVPGDHINDSYTVHIRPSGSTGFASRTSYNIARVDAQGNLGATTNQTVETGKDHIVVTLKKDEKVYVTGLPAGTYTVAEVIGENTYTLQSMKVNGGKVEFAQETRTDHVHCGRDDVEVSQYSITNVEFTNTYNVHGWLYITKKIGDTTGYTDTQLSSMTFPITVKLDGVDLPSTVKVYSSLKTGDTIITLTNGAFTWNIHHNEVISLALNAAHGDVKVTVTEDTSNKGFDVVYSPANGEGTVGEGTVTIPQKNETATVSESGGTTGTPDLEITITNTPTWSTQQGKLVDLKIGKEISGRDWKDGDEFTFKLQRLGDQNHWNDITNGAVSIAEDTAEHQADLSAVLTADLRTLKAGTYRYRIVEEQQNSVTNVASDVRIPEFEVTVGDDTVDGYLEITGIKGIQYLEAKENKDEDIWIISEKEKDAPFVFVNKYTPDGTTVQINLSKTVNDGERGTDYSPAGFWFGLYDAPGEDGELVLDPVRTDGGGEAAFSLTFGPEVFENSDKTGYMTQKEITYYLKEIEQSQELRPGITFDDTVYEVKITLVDKLALGENTDENDTVGATVVLSEYNSQTVLYAVTNQMLLDLDEPVQEEAASNKLTAPAEGEATPNEGEPTPNEGEPTPNEGETTPNEGETTPNEGETTPSEGEPTPNEGDAAQEEVEIVAADEVEGEPSETPKPEDQPAEPEQETPAPEEEVPMPEEEPAAPEGETAKTEEETPQPKDEAGEEPQEEPEEPPMPRMMRMVAPGQTLIVPLSLSSSDPTAKFENRYDPANAELTLNGVKVLQGRDWMDSDKFEFALYSATVEGTEWTKGQKVKSGYAENGNTADELAAGQRTFRIDSLSFDKVGSYYFILEEVVAEGSGITVDTAYRITVEVKDDPAAGRLVANVKEITPTNGQGSSTALVFANTYKAAPVTPEITAAKILRGRTLREKEFTFNLYAADDSFVIQSATPLQTVQNDSTGQVKFVLDQVTPEQLDANGTLTSHYVVVEEEGSLYRVDYDTTIFGVKLVISDPGTGMLKATVTYRNLSTGKTAEEIKFVNTYTPPSGRRDPDKPKPEEKNPDTGL